MDSESSIYEGTLLEPRDYADTHRCHGRDGLTDGEARLFMMRDLLRRQRDLDAERELTAMLDPSVIHLDDGDAYETDADDADAI